MTPGQSCPHNLAEAAQLAVPTGGRITGHVGDIRDCPACHLPCHVVDGAWPAHGCRGGG